MPNTPTKNFSEIANPDTYVGQSQPIGGTENTANPPTVNVGAMPPIAITSVEVTGGALNTATPPAVIPVDRLNYTNQAEAAPNYIPVDSAGNGHNNKTHPPTYIPVGQANGSSQVAVAPSFVPISVEGAGHTNETKPPLFSPVSVGGVGSSNATKPPAYVPYSAVVDGFTQVEKAPSYVPISAAGAGRTNAANPPSYVPVSAGGGVSQVAAAPSFVPVSSAGAGVTNAANPPKVFTEGSGSTVQPVGAGAGTTNTTNPPLAVPARPSQRVGGTHYFYVASNQSGSQNIDNLAATTAYITTIVLSGVNTGLAGTLTLLDQWSGVAGVTQLAIQIPAGGAAAPASSVPITAITITLQEPIILTGQLRIAIASATLNWSITLIGYK